MTETALKAGIELMQKIESTEKQISSREKDIFTIERQRYSPKVKCEVNVDYKNENKENCHHNFTLIISEETIIKELRNQIFTLKNQLFCFKSKLKNL